MERFAVQNVGSMELLTDWLETEAQAQAAAAECEAHETQPECRIVRFSEWAPGQRLAHLAYECWGGDCPVVYDNGNGKWLMTGEIVSVKEAGYIVTACKRAAYKREG